MKMTYFERQGFGASIGEAFWTAHREAQEQAGANSDLHTKTTFEEINTPTGVNPLKYAEWIRQACCSLKTDASEWDKKRYLLFVPKARQTKVLSLAQAMVDESKTLGLRLRGPAASAFRIKNGIKGKHGKVFLFIGVG
ncbi:hypothetical protein [Microscilla marina]|uniref:Uncharacterized protein n=1 Tax=Microscilla marina ATCC 23134 TaxID=313606 RepID=A1ZMK7_MICM2|nr:hypothetical protein [Microscilla marina]EAY28387.1 hypothetical protein M23134_03939 [Microscilla marina ATCC 23134]